MRSEQIGTIRTLRSSDRARPPRPMRGLGHPDGTPRWVPGCSAACRRHTMPTRPDDEARANHGYPTRHRGLPSVAPGKQARLAMRDSSYCCGDAHRACACSRDRGPAASPIAHPVGSEAWLREVAARHRHDARAVAASAARGTHPCCRKAGPCSNNQTSERIDA